VNGGDRLLRTLRSLAIQTRPVPIVVVDNGSAPGALDAIRSELPEVQIQPMGSNLGFGPALNRAVREISSEVLIFLNDDVECQPTFVEAMLDELSKDTMMVAGVLLQGANERLIDSAGIVIDSTLMGFDYLHGETVDVLAEAPPPLGPTGGAVLLRTAAFARVGGFDERIFAYQEDVDIVLRLRRAGASCRLAREARGVHRHSATLGSGSASKNWHMGWSRGYLLRRYGVLNEPRRAARALVAEAVICAGQAFVDRTLSGVTGRLQGWRAGTDLPKLEFSYADVAEISLRQALGRRSRRRSMPWRPLKLPRRGYLEQDSG
jgi:N-acetylglucosaminyl-diphospho-decaprenol L-rhamnosyltransferase